MRQSPRSSAEGGAMNETGAIPRGDAAATPTDGVPWPGRADGVFRGGGVKGAALAGAIAGMYDHPTKPVREWVNVAGASAGAILAGYLAVHGHPEGIVDEVNQIPYKDLQDFPKGHRTLGVLNLLWGGHGLARGDGFERWFDSEM